MKRKPHRPPYDERRASCQAPGPFNVSLRPLVRPDVLMPHWAAKRCVYVTTLVRNARTESGAASMECRPCLSIAMAKAWPFSHAKVQLENGGRIARASAWRLTPFRYDGIRAMYRALRKAGIVVTTQDGDSLPESYSNLDKTARNISRSIVGKYRQPNEFIVCQKLEV